MLSKQRQKWERFISPLLSSSPFPSLALLSKPFRKLNILFRTLSYSDFLFFLKTSLDTVVVNVYFYMSDVLEGVEKISQDG